MNKLQKFKVSFINQWIIFKSQKTSIIILLINIIFMFILSLSGLFILGSKATIELKYILINLFIIFNSIYIIFLGIYFTLNTLFSQLINGIYKLELKNGININQVFLSRLVFIICLLVISLLANFILSLIFFAIFNSINPKDILAYRLYISSVGWYAIWTLIVISFSMLFSMLLSKESLISLLASLISFIFLVLISISGILSIISNSSKNSLSIRETNRYALEYDYWNKLKKQVNNSHHLKLLNDEIQQISYSTIDELMAGYKYWCSNIQKCNNLDNFKNISHIMQRIFNNSNILNWEDIIGFSSNSNSIFNENIEVVAKYGLEKAKLDEKWIFNFILNNSSNSGYYKYLDLTYYPKIGEVGTRAILDEIKLLYTPDEYLMTRVLIEGIYFSNQVYKFAKTQYESIDFGDIIIQNNKNQKIKNILNPINHFILMFQSIDYKNQVLMNFIGAEQILFTSKYNIHVNVKDDNWSNLKLERDVYVEIYYLIYTVLLIFIIYISYILYRKKVYKF